MRASLALLLLCACGDRLEYRCDHAAVKAFVRSCVQSPRCSSSYGMGPAEDCVRAAESLYCAWVHNGKPEGGHVWRFERGHWRMLDER